MTKVIISYYDEQDNLVQQTVYPEGTDPRIVVLAFSPEGLGDGELQDKVFFSDWECGELMREEVQDVDIK